MKDTSLPLMDFWMYDYVISILKKEAEKGGRYFTEEGRKMFVNNRWDYHYGKPSMCIKKLQEIKERHSYLVEEGL